MATEPHGLPSDHPHRVTIWPTTRRGRWAIGMAAASVALLLGWSVVGRLGGIPGLLLGIAGGVAALDAIVRRGERGLTVYAAFLPFATIVAFLLASLGG